MSFNFWYLFILNRLLNVVLCFFVVIVDIGVFLNVNLFVLGFVINILNVLLRLFFVGL